MSRIKTSKFIGEKIKQRRRNLGMTQEELAEKLGVTYQQVQRYENGSNKLNVEQIQNIAALLDAPVTLFFDIEQDYVKEGNCDYLPTQREDKEYEGLLKSIKKIKMKKHKRLYLEFAKLILKVESIH